MNNNYFKGLFGLALLSGFLLLFNTLYYRFIDDANQPGQFEYPLAVLYSIFFILAAIVTGALTYIDTKNKEQLGYAFLLLTGAKMALCYIFARPIIAKGEAASAEKVNFFIIFIIFLIIEALYTARLLNKKQ